MEAKTVKETCVVMPVRMMPQDANPAGYVHAGVVLRYIDLVGAMVAMHHARTAVVTVSIDRMDFLTTANVGEAVNFKASVNYVGTTSMEVGVRVEAENLFTGEIRHAGSAYLTFVGVDKERKPTLLPQLLPATPDEHRRFAEALRRRESRKDERRSERAGQAETAASGGNGETAAAPVGSAAGGKPPGESNVVMPVRMMPQDANPAGDVHGGVILKHIDLAGAIAAMRHCRSAVVTSSIDRMEFLATGRVGEVMSFKASVNYVEGANMEVGVRVEAENLFTGEIRHAGSAYLTFTALDADRAPVPVPPLASRTPDERRRYGEAMRRRATRQAERQRERAAQAEARE
jgi:acyl-CoA hydrolase